MVHVPVAPSEYFRKQELLNDYDSFKKWRVGSNRGWGIHVKTIEMFASVAPAVPWVDGSDQYNLGGGGAGSLPPYERLLPSPDQRSERLDHVINTFGRQV
jgi:hypothetical protein